MKRNYTLLFIIISTLAAVNTAYARFLQMDPMAEKYPGISPYAYCDNNPLKYIDPDGNEKILGVTKREPGYEEIKNYSGTFGKNDPTIHIWGHGDSEGIMLGGMKYTEPDKFKDYLNDNSENWGKRDKDGFTMIVLHSCSTGSEGKSFAQRISESKDFKDVLIVAPSDKVRITNDGKSVTESVDSGSAKGLWLMFLNGFQVNSFDGSSKPYLNHNNQRNNYKNKLKLKRTGELKTADDFENEKEKEEDE